MAVLFYGGTTQATNLAGGQELFIENAFQTVAALNEPLEMNAVRRHTHALEDTLLSTSLHSNEDQARQLAASRLCGPSRNWSNPSSQPRRF